MNMAIVRGILRESIRNLGPAGSVVNIKRGYFRFLHQSQKVVYATSEALKIMEIQRADLERQDLERKNQAEKLIQLLKNYTLTIQMEASEKGMLYGSVTPRDIIKHLESVTSELSIHHIFLGSPIKEIGKYSIKIEPYPHVSTTINLMVTNLHGHQEEQDNTEPQTKQKEKKQQYIDDRYGAEEVWHDEEE